MAALERAGVKWVLVGTHGANVYHDQSRATGNVDALVRARDYGIAIENLRGEFPRLRVEEKAGLACFVDFKFNVKVMHLLKPASPLYKAALSNSVPIARGYSIPTLEMALAEKFATIALPDYPMDRRYQAAADFANIVGNNRNVIELAKLQELADLYGAGVNDDGDAIAVPFDFMPPV